MSNITGKGDDCLAACIIAQIADHTIWLGESCLDRFEKMANVDSAVMGGMDVHI